MRISGSGFIVGKIDTPKTDNSTRQAALSAGCLGEIEAWRIDGG